MKRSITLKSTGRTPTLIENVTNKTVYNILRDNIKEAPTIENKLIKYYSEDVDPSLIYSLPYKITKSTTLQCFQFKTTQGFYPTNAYLQNVKIQETNLCKSCEIEDTLEHYFVTCRTTRTLWEQMKNLINPISCLSNAQILFGVLKTDKLSLTVNWANYYHLLPLLNTSNIKS